MMKRLFFLIMLSACIPVLADAQATDTITAAKATTPARISYIERLSYKDRFTDAMVTLHHSDAIERLLRLSSAETRTARGFRIQLYSSNRGAKAREEAFEIEKTLLEKQPNLEVYVSYEAPFWKVRVGNCVDHSAAQEFRQWVIGEFPDYAPETYIVPSEIQIKE
ncbi:MAG: hypothetical protein IAC51_03690 [bacterium]|uniref:SPOR domain-containing protein n=1 Tax=Candidatus Aphodosoma intestinipullorum TaxID=2840674 RepID=A0A940DKP6_9BACT|nr:hypothetical protein [Candidatus Aphodosoma intestinipullorum]